VRDHSNLPKYRRMVGWFLHLVNSRFGMNTSMGLD
jgi:hypothetical protein